MASEQFSLRLPKDTKCRLEELAQATGRRSNQFWHKFGKNKTSNPSY